jgi:Ca-activated chloride channel family protein
MPGLVDGSKNENPESNGHLGVLSTPRGPLVLQGLNLHAQIDGLAAVVEVRQRFHNPYDEPVEATYIFPLPDRAAVTRFRLKLGDRLIEGLLQERAAAREQYEEALRAGHTAAITEEERPNVFSLRVGNLAPGVSAEVELMLLQPLGYDEGEATFQFPLVVAPRYIPGIELPGMSVGLGVNPDTDAVPDASRISPPVLLPGYPYPVRLGGTVKLANGLSAVGQASLPIHHTRSEGGYEVWDLVPGSRLDRDFILRFQMAKEKVSSQLAIAPDEAAKGEATFALTLVPPSRDATARPRRLVFVLDRSGSMEGWKLVAARRALGRMIDSLSPADRFRILAFDTVVEALPRERVAWYEGNDRQRFEALQALATIHARGGTELASPLSEAVSSLAEGDSEAERVLVLITDGQVGNEDQLLRLIGNRLKGLRVFTLGIDQAVNEGFLRRLAMLGGGAAELVESEDRLDAVMARIHRRIASPVLRDLKLTAEGLQLEPGTIVPARLPDVFPGAPLVITGRCAAGASGVLRLQATDDTGRSWEQVLEPHAATSLALRWTWARSLLRAWEDEYVGQPSEALEKRIIALSLQQGLLCRFTAFVAVDRRQVVNAGGQVLQIVQPVELPAGWAAPVECAAASMVCASVSVARYQCVMPSQVKHRKLLSTQIPPVATAKVSPEDLGQAHFVTQCVEDAYALESLEAYRNRVEELLSLVKDSTGDPQQILGMLKVKLTELIDDLKSVGFPFAAYRELYHLWQLMEKPGGDAQQLLESARSTFESWINVKYGGRSASFWK